METSGESSQNSWKKDIEADAMDNEKLSEMFDNGFEMYNNLNKSEEPTNSIKIQSTIKSIMNIFENVTRLVSLIDMFSSNESFEEVPTENLKFLLLPALLGTLTTKLCGSENRFHIVDVAEVYFVDFLKRVKLYELIDMEIPEVKHDVHKKSASVCTKSNAELITEMVNSRNTKIERYRERKELEKKLDVLQKHLSNPNIDDENKREYFVTLIKLFANKAIDELNALAAERPILEHIQTINKDLEGNIKVSEKHNKHSIKLQPIIITRDALQKKVFGMGYPSLPVMTVQEFYDQKVKDGEWPKQVRTNDTNLQKDVADDNIDENMQKDAEDEEKEEKIEKDDIETLASIRAMDEYKDTHRRGWGNRFNRS